MLIENSGINSDLKSTAQMNQIHTRIEFKFSAMIVQECMTLNIAVIGVQRDWAALMAAFLASLLFFLISSFSFV